MGDTVTFTDRERAALAAGQARIYQGRIVPIISGGEETPEEKADREAAEAAAREKKFTQADVDRIVQDRLARDRKERPSDDEIAELRDKAKKFDDAEAANASDLEKAQKRAEKAERDREEALTRVKETNLRSAILAEAAKPDRKVLDPEAVLSLLDRSKLELDDDGTPKNIAEAMDALLTAKTYLVDGGTGTTTRSDADQGARQTTGGVEQLKSTDGMTAEQIADAAAKGQLDEYLKAPK
jgi:hypothetical protein